VQIVETQVKPKRVTTGQKERNQSQHCKREMGPDCILIKDLYERMHRFRIICRVNHIESFMSMKGNPCVRMMLIDESGDEIFCLLYDKAAGRLSNIQNARPTAHSIFSKEGPMYLKTGMWRETTVVL
jgi:hypothetical protein